VGRASRLDSVASRLVRGLDAPSLEEEVAVIAAARPDDLRPVLVALAGSLLVLLPSDHEPGEDLVQHLESAWGARHGGLTGDPHGRTGKELSRAIMTEAGGDGPLRLVKAGDRIYSGKLFSRARGLDVMLLPERLVLVAPGEVHILPLDEIALVGSDEDGDVEVVTRRGAAVMLNPTHFRGLSGPFWAMVEALPGALRYDKQRVKVAPPEDKVSAER
jgi:hypothetical protein